MSNKDRQVDYDIVRCRHYNTVNKTVIISHDLCKVCYPMINNTPIGYMVSEANFSEFLNILNIFLRISLTI